MRMGRCMCFWMHCRYYMHAFLLEGNQVLRLALCDAEL